MDHYDDILTRGFDEYREFVNPLIAQRAAIAGEPIRIARTKDGVLYDHEGHAFEDFHGTQAFGHRNPYIADAVRRYLDSDAASWYPSRVNPFAGRLARRLCERAGHYDNAFFACTGSDAVEASLKLARALTRRPRILGLEGAYHGCTFGSVSLMSRGYLRDPFAPFVEGAEHVPFGDVDALEKTLAPGDVAAIVVEPIQGEGGVRELPRPFVEALCELTEKHGTLLVADEIQTALGRTGRGFLATASWPRRPDVVLMAKHLGGGLLPISAMLTRRETFLRAYGNDFSSGESHNTTMGFNALSCVAALAALDLLTDERIARVHELGARLKKGLTDALSRSPLFREARGAGFMQGVALAAPDHPWLSFEHFGFSDLGNKSVISPLMCHRLYRRGFFCFTCGHDWSIFRLQPRFDIPAERLDAFVSAVAEELEYIEGLG
ncbi:aspartate aminotransferase family protein [Polyangium aurulentum]|uniref:aspartate aminotransferase family protein n=1 Tax=Polyangium aurulentum TaxID=2567896 RepID=UPI00146C1F06|nr:aspartate aminotransferase family protein [Polyangium aurulentum]UQA63368.1 aspartate aminotransferase family protein [Polyangium aurulentum]